MERQEADPNESVFGDAVGYETWFGTAICSLVDELERRVLRRILADTPQGAEVAIGAATGHFARALADRLEIIAVDPSPAICREGRLRAAGLPTLWCVGVGEHRPLAESCVDGAPVMTTLEWAEDSLRCLSEARRGGCRRYPICRNSPSSPTRVVRWA